MLLTSSVREYLIWIRSSKNGWTMMYMYLLMLVLNTQPGCRQ